MRRKLATFFAAILVLLVAAIYMFLLPWEAKRPPPGDIGRPKLAETAVPFEHKWDPDTAHPLVGAAAIDHNGDGRDAIFLGGSTGQPDALIVWKDGKLVDIAAQVGIGDEAPTYGALSLDIDADGDTDLLTAGGSGIVLWRNGAGRFTREALDVEIPSDSVPMALTAADYDRDGDPDLYVSMFVAPQAFRSPVFNDPEHAKRNLLLRNDGDLTFTDVTDIETAGLQNTFTASFADLDGDRLPDLVLAQNTGEVELIRNLGGGKFKRSAFHSGFGFWMGLAFGDIDRDGDLDVFLSNIGNSIPAALVKGDRRDDQTPNNEWLVLRNDGDFRFTDVTGDVGADGFGFAWGGAFQDVNHDGVLDLLVAENYVKWPVHKLFKLPGKTLLGAQASQPRFYTSDAAENAATGHVPLIADLDGDGQNDIVWVNMNAKARAYMNRTGGRFVAARLPDTPQAIGARVRLEGVDAPVQAYIAGEGLTSDRTTQLSLGLADDAPDPTALVVEWADGAETRIDRPKIGAPIAVEKAPRALATP
jgi:enediyne biosynthesis protein E4